MSRKPTSAKRKAAPAPPSIPPYTEGTWPVERLKAYERNARKHSPQQIRQLRSSFQKFGQVWPILVRGDGTIIAGHGRLEAAKAEGFKEVRVIIADGWSEEQCRAFGLLDNKVALNSEWDEALLGVELADLAAMGVDLDSLGFAVPELDELLAPGGNAGLTDADEEAPAPPAVPISRAGDVWLLGKHRILCGDSTSAEDVARLLGGVKPHLMVTDPPYGVEYDANWRNDREQAGSKSVRGAPGGRAVGKVANDDRADWSAAWALFPGDVAYVWHAALHTAEVFESLVAEGFELRAQIIWDKSRHVISRGHYHWKHEPCWYAVRKSRTASWHGDRSQMTVWSIPHVKSDTGHSTQKPVECMKRPIENNSSPGQAVYEPFSGSGTTIIAAEMTGRCCFAMEINPAYVDVAVRRWQEFTGQVAMLEGDGRSFAAIEAERAPPAAAEAA